MSQTARKGRVVVTCGPSFEPIDQVRRITNLSTGKLGILLANRLARSGWEVTCFRGEMATCADPLHGPDRISFTTNEDLLKKLQALPYRDEVAAVFHAAALCDYKVKQATSASGELMPSGKIPTRSGEITLSLEPTVKVLGELRSLFPRSRIVGWKYEVEGTREDVVEKGWQQLATNGTDACVLNGPAFGEGFGVMERVGSEIAQIGDRLVLCEWLAGWLRGKGWVAA